MAENKDITQAEKVADRLQTVPYVVIPGLLIAAAQLTDTMVRKGPTIVPDRNEVRSTFIHNLNFLRDMMPWERA